MEKLLKKKYEGLSDREIVAEIITEPYNEEAAAYLICGRYGWVCASICKKTLGGVQETDQLQSDLFMHLKGKECDWNNLRTFEWRSTLKSWLSSTAYRLSLRLRKELFNKGMTISVDDWESKDTKKLKPIGIINDVGPQYERNFQMVLLQEAINMLKNSDQKFVVSYRLAGFSSNEVAVMLKIRWEKEGIVRYNKENEIVVPTDKYINNLFHKGYDKVIEIYKSLEI